MGVQRSADPLIVSCIQSYYSRVKVELDGLSRCTHVERPIVKLVDVARDDVRKLDGGGGASALAEQAGNSTEEAASEVFTGSESSLSSAVIVTCAHLDEVDVLPVLGQDVLAILADEVVERETEDIGALRKGETRPTLVHGGDTALLSGNGGGERHRG